MMHLVDSRESGATPLTPEELVPDIALRALAKGDPARQVGEISTQDQSVLAMYLPDICGELLAYRALARKGVI